MKRILYLDDDYPSALKKYTGEKLCIVAEMPSRWHRLIESHPCVEVEDFLFFLDQDELYHPPRENLTAIELMAASGKFDLVVIGNKLGGGLAKAGHIPSELRMTGIIIWNAYIPGVEKPYEELGYQHFMARSDLSEYLAQAFK